MRRLVGRAASAVPAEIAHLPTTPRVLHPGDVWQLHLTEQGVAVDQAKVMAGQLELELNGVTGRFDIPDPGYSVTGLLRVLRFRFRTADADAVK